MNLSDILLWLHIIGAVIWIGTALTMEGLTWRIRRTGTVKQLRDLFAVSAWLSKRYYMPASSLTLLAGVGLVITHNHFTFSQPWVLIGLGGFLVASVLGAGFISPTMHQIGQLLEHHDLRNSDVVGQLNRLAVLSRLDIALLLVILLDMVIKPTWDSGLFWATAAILLILAFIVGDKPTRLTAK